MLRIAHNKTFSALKQLLILTALGLPVCAHADTLDDAQNAFNNGQYPTAVIELKNLLQKEPDNIAGRLLLGRAYLQQFDVLAAIKELETAKQLGAPLNDWLVPLSRTYLLSGQNDKVIEAVAQLSQLDMKNQAELLAIIGHAQLATNQIADAKESFKQALSKHPNAYAKVGLARIALLEKQIDNALTLIEEALKFEPDNLDALLSKSQALAIKGNFEKSIEPLDRALAKESRLENARLMRAELYIRTQQLTKARTDAETLLRQNPNNGVAHFTLARLQLNDQQYAEAQTSGEKALRILPDHLMTYFVLGAAHYAQQNFQQAQFHLEKFVTAQPNHLIGARLLGAVYLQLGETKNAVKLLQNFDANSSTKDAYLLNLLGRAYLQSGDYTQGTETLNRALKLDPNIKNARTQLAIGEIATGDINKAIVELENAVGLPDATEQTSIMLILSYLNKRDFDKTFAAIDKANQQYPNNGVFYNLKGLAFESQQDFDAARSAYQQALKVDKHFIPARLALAKIDIKNNAIDSARKQLEQALEINKNNLQALLLMAQSSQLQGDINSMTKWLQKARDRNPDAALPVNLLTNYYLSTGQTDKALSEASLYYTAQGKTITSLSLMASVSFARGETDKARSFLQEIIANYPEDINHRLQLAQLHMTAREFPQALGYLDEVLTLQPDNGSALVARASTLIASDQLNEAEAAIKQFSEKHPAHFMVNQLQGDFLMAQKDITGAQKAYSDAFSQSKTAYLAKALGQIHEQAGNLQQAVDVINDYLEVTPNDQQTRIVLASLYQRIGDNQRAISAYEQIIEATPGNVIAQNNLAWLYWQEKSTKALATAEKAYQLAPDNAAVIDTYGWIMLHQGDKSRALKLIRAAITKSPTNPDIRYHLAKALAENGDSAQAKKEVTRLLRDYGDFEEKLAASTLAAELE